MHAHANACLCMYMLVHMHRENMFANKSLKMFSNKNLSFFRAAQLPPPSNVTPDNTPSAAIIPADHRPRKALQLGLSLGVPGSKGQHVAEVVAHREVHCLAHHAVHGPRDGAAPTAPPSRIPTVWDSGKTPTEVGGQGCAGRPGGGGVDFQ